MPIIVNLDVMLAKRKMRLNTVAERVDITAQNLSILKTGKAKAIRFSTLEKLCEARKAATHSRGCSRAWPNCARNLYVIRCIR